MATYILTFAHTVTDYAEVEVDADDFITAREIAWDRLKDSDVEWISDSAETELIHVREV
jgi:hypothetical protein